MTNQEATDTTTFESTMTQATKSHEADAFAAACNVVRGRAIRERDTDWYAALGIWAPPVGEAESLKTAVDRALSVRRREARASAMRDVADVFREDEKSREVVDYIDAQIRLEAASPHAAPEPPPLRRDGLVPGARRRDAVTAPERIWLVYDAETDGVDASWVEASVPGPVPGSTVPRAEYVRADVHERALDEKREDLAIVMDNHRASLNELAEAKRNAEFWEKGAARFSRNENYYRDLLDLIGHVLGPEAFTADDGSVSIDPLVAKLPELVERLTGRDGRDETIRELHGELASALRHVSARDVEPAAEDSALSAPSPAPITVPLVDRAYLTTRGDVQRDINIAAKLTDEEAYALRRVQRKLGLGSTAETLRYLIVVMDRPGDGAEERAALTRLERASERVLVYSWEDNDEDAFSAIEELRSAHAGLRRARTVDAENLAATRELRGGDHG